MTEGLWTGEWRSNITNIENHGAGTFLFADGVVHGGDTGYFYVGSYQKKGHELQGEFHFQHYSGDPIGILGYATEGILVFEGVILRNQMTIEMKLKDLPTVRLTGVLTKRMDLGENLQSSLAALDRLPPG